MWRRCTPASPLHSQHSTASTPAVGAAYDCAEPQPVLRTCTPDSSCSIHPAARMARRPAAAAATSSHILHHTAALPVIPAARETDQRPSRPRGGEGSSRGRQAGGGRSPPRPPAPARHGGRRAQRRPLVGQHAGAAIPGQHEPAKQQRYGAAYDSGDHLGQGAGGRGQGGGLGGGYAASCCESPDAASRSRAGCPGSRPGKEQGDRARGSSGAGLKAAPVAGTAQACTPGPAPHLAGKDERVAGRGAAAQVLAEDDGVEGEDKQKQGVAAGAVGKVGGGWGVGGSGLW